MAGRACHRSKSMAPELSRAAARCCSWRSTWTMDLTRRIERPRDREDETLTAGERPPRREWLVTNGLGGYASGTVAGMLTRRYHGMLVASLPAPLGRMVMLNHLLERVRLPGEGVVGLGGQEEGGGRHAGA